MKFLLETMLSSKRGDPMASSVKKEKKAGKFQWFVFLILIPVLFALVLGTVILSILGVNVADLGKNAIQDFPLAAAMFEEEKSEESVESTDVINEKEEEITRLQQELDTKNQEIRTLEEELEELHISMEAEREEEEPASNSHLKEVAQIYENMSAGKAAAILSEMNNGDILLHMEEMSTEARASILGKMEPEKAAKIMNELND